MSHEILYYIKGHKRSLLNLIKLFNANETLLNNYQAREEPRRPSILGQPPPEKDQPAGSLQKPPGGLHQPPANRFGDGAFRRGGGGGAFGRGGFNRRG